MKPQDFFITARDFFAVIVPGALLVLLVGAITPELNIWVQVRDVLGEDASTLNLTICFVCTYAVGTVLGGLGSRLDWFSDKITKMMMNSVGGRDTVRFGFRKMDKLRQTEILAQELEMELAPGMRALHVDSRPWSTRAFWWNYLRLNCPEAMIELDRVEGQQKQFRSMTIGGAVMAVVYLREGEARYMLLALGIMMFMAFSYWGHRNRFARRLFELAIVHAVPKHRFETSGGKFFDAETRWNAITRQPASRTAQVRSETGE